MCPSKHHHKNHVCNHKCHQLCPEKVHFCSGNWQLNIYSKGSENAELLNIQPQKGHLNHPFQDSENAEEERLERILEPGQVVE